MRDTLFVSNLRFMEQASASRRGTACCLLPSPSATSSRASVCDFNARAPRSLSDKREGVERQFKLYAPNIMVVGVDLLVSS